MVRFSCSLALGLCLMMFGSAFAQPGPPGSSETPRMKCMLAQIACHSAKVGCVSAKNTAENKEDDYIIEMNAKQSLLSPQDDAAITVLNIEATVIFNAGMAKAQTAIDVYDDLCALQTQYFDDDLDENSPLWTNLKDDFDDCKDDLSAAATDFARARDKWQDCIDILDLYT